MPPSFSFPQAEQDAHPLFGGSVSLQNDSVCYVKAAFPLMGKILERTEFKENSSNARKMQMVRRMYTSIDENVEPCIREEDDEERTVQ